MVPWAVSFGVALLAGLALGCGPARGATPEDDDPCATHSGTIADSATRLLFYSWCRGETADFAQWLRPDGSRAPPLELDAREPFAPPVELDAREPFAPKGAEDACLQLAGRRLARVPAREIAPDAIRSILEDPTLGPHVKGKPLKIRCARFPDGLDLSLLAFERDVVIDASLFERTLSAARARFGGDLVITSSVFWGASPPFWSEATPFLGVAASTACTARLDLQRASIAGRLKFTANVTNFALDLEDLRIEQGVLISRSAFEYEPTSEHACGSDDEAILAQTMMVGGELALRQVRLRGPARFSGSSVGRHVSLEDIRITPAASLQFSRVVVKRHFAARSIATCAKLHADECDDVERRNGDAEDAALVLRYAEIGDQLHLRGVALTRLSLGRAKIGQAVQIAKSKIRLVRAPGLAVGGDLVLDSPNRARSQPNGAGNAGRALEASRVWVCHIELAHAHIKGRADFANARLGVLDMSHARVEGPLAFLRKGIETSWQVCERAGASAPIQLRLKGLRAASLSARHGSFPPDRYRVDLDGFSVDRIEPVDDDRPTCDAKSCAGRELDAVLRLLENNARSLEPFVVVARVYRNAGRQSEADTIMHTGRRQMHASDPSIIGWIQAVTTGFGYTPWLIFVWIAGLTLAGAAVLRWQNEFAEERVSHNQKNHSAFFFVGRYMYFCFDHLLPIIKLRDLHYRNEKLRPFSEGSMFVLRIMGYVLTAGVIASLSAIAPIVK